MNGKKVKKLRKEFLANGGGSKRDWRKFKRLNLNKK
jgi:hypothetical protein